MSEHRVAERVALALMLAGTGIAIVAVTVWVLNVIPPPTDWIARLAIYKLTLASGAGLLIAGAVLRRGLRRDRPASGIDAAQLGEGAAPPIPADDRTAQRANTRRTE